MIKDLVVKVDNMNRWRISVGKKMKTIEEMKKPAKTNVVSERLPSNALLEDWTQLKKEAVKIVFVVFELF